MQRSGAVNGPEGQTGTDWNAINWRKADRIVRNLRQRIFRAAQANDLRRVRSLQKLMLRSYSNVLVGVRQVTQVNAGKYTPGVDRLVVKKLVKRATSSADKRETVVSLTAAGINILQLANVEVSKVFDDLLNIDDGEAKLLNGLLEKFRAAE